MQLHLQRFSFKLFKSFEAVIRLFLQKPAYFLLALLFFLTALTILLWFFNFELLAYIIFEAPVTLFVKIEFILSVYGALFTDFTPGAALTMLVFSFLFGINSSLLVYAHKQKLKSSKKKSGFLASVLAILGAGCIACGTSILAPLVASSGAIGVVFLHEVSLLFYWVAIGLTIYSMYELGKLLLTLSPTSLQ